MKIKDLIKLLNKYDQESTVVVNGYESGYDEVKSAELIAIKKNKIKTDNWWDGEFSECDPDDPDSLEIALLLPRRH